MTTPEELTGAEAAELRRRMRARLRESVVGVLGATCLVSAFLLLTPLGAWVLTTRLMTTPDGTPKPDIDAVDIGASCVLSLAASLLTPFLLLFFAYAWVSTFHIGVRWFVAAIWVTSSLIATLHPAYLRRIHFEIREQLISERRHAPRGSMSPEESVPLAGALSPSHEHES